VRYKFKLVLYLTRVIILHINTYYLCTTPNDTVHPVSRHLDGQSVSKPCHRRSSNWCKPHALQAKTSAPAPSVVVRRAATCCGYLGNSSRLARVLLSLLSHAWMLLRYITSSIYAVLIIIFHSAQRFRDLICSEISTVFQITAREERSS